MAKAVTFQVIRSSADTTNKRGESMNREERLEIVADPISLIKQLIVARAESDKGNINYKLIALANEGVDEVMDFLLTATPAKISELGHLCKIKEAEMNPSYTKPKDDN